ncbi:uncharacterized protein LOC112568581 isoform X2 [Pomacea canaliculata]|uniref:uncharacterized protein LOC112568581 isoform X2 n=1 Tax=Pomacea canaliculata TaxID=400727 RepID=UPI000D732EFB|nr:uncharacterized protein LOC112568581 isoform X2 [Pomacea canaliculata]
MATSPDSLPSTNILIVVSHTRLFPKQNKVSIESIVKMAHGPVTAVVMFLIACHRTLAISLQSKTEVEELSFNKRSVSCDQLTPNSTIYWTISPLQGQVKQNVSRDWAGTVVCTERLLNETEQSVNSTLDVYHNSGVSNSSFVINREDWSLTFMLNVPKVFSALGNYGVEVRCLEMTSKVNVSLVSYNESSRMYNVGYFSVTLRANFTGYKDRYKVISPYSCFSNIFLHPGTKHYREAQYRHYSLYIPRIRCNQSYIPEEGPVSCSCNGTFKYHPDARLRWMLGEKVVASGDYGVEWLPLPPEVVNRSHDRTILECEVEWLYNMRYLHWIQVAYGPDDITIKPYSVLYQKYSSNETLLAAYPVVSGHVYLPPSGSTQVTLVCEARNVKPLKSEMVTWGGLCDGQLGFNCKLTFKGKLDNGKVVTCTVTNDANNNHTANTSIFLNVSGGPDTVGIQYHTTSTPGKCLVNVTCEAPGVKPSTCDMFTWGGMCEGQQGSRCVITADNEQDDGKEVTCTVTNHVNHGRSARASVTLMLSGCEVKDDLMGKGVGIGIGVTLTLVLLVVGVVVVVVIWRRRRFQQDTTYEKPSQDPGVSHTYEMTRAGHDPRTQESQEQIVVAPFPPCEVYENVTSDITVKPVKAKQRRKTQKQ